MNALTRFEKIKLLLKKDGDRNDVGQNEVENKKEKNDSLVKQRVLQKKLSEL